MKKKPREKDHINNMILSRMAKRGITGANLSNRTGISPGNLSRSIRGNIRSDKANLIIELLGGLEERELDGWTILVWGEPAE